MPVTVLHAQQLRILSPRGQIREGVFVIHFDRVLRIQSDDTTPFHIDAGDPVIRRRHDERVVEADIKR